MSEQPYDSKADTEAHIREVRNAIYEMRTRLEVRAALHDRSKLKPPEKEAFDAAPPLKGITYGSPEYQASLEKLAPALKLHYSANSHHPEHYPNGMNGMSLLDLVEWFCDCHSATKKHADGNFARSLEINKERFAVSDQLAQIFENTRKEMGW